MRPVDPLAERPDSITVAPLTLRVMPRTLLALPRGAEIRIEVFAARHPDNRQIDLMLADESGVTRAASWTLEGELAPVIFPPRLWWVPGVPGNYRVTAVLTRMMTERITRAIDVLVVGDWAP